MANGEAQSTDVLAQLTQAAADWLGGAGDAAQSPTPGGAVTAVLVSNIAPPIDLSGGQGGGIGAQLVKWIQPTISGTLPVVGAVNVAPYGAANPAVGTLVFYGVLSLATYGLYKLVTRR